jgi:release factor glutamine methyltransferase
MLTVLEIIKRSTDFLALREIASPRLNAEVLIGHALGRSRMQLYLEFERPLTETELTLIRPLIKRRSLHEPLQYILGHVDFGGGAIKVDRRALIPRPETELLVEFVVAWAKANPPADRMADLGTGSGAIALALARALPSATVVAAESDPNALALARENFALAGLGNRVEAVASDWFSGIVPPAFDIVVSNPPYLSEQETAETAPEIRQFEPKQALVANDGGYADLERIISAAPLHLRPGGLLALETGIAQHPRLLEKVQSVGFSQAESKCDLAGRDRFILAVL